MKISGIRVAEGYEAPWWAGVAYYSCYDDYAIYYPIPLNLIARWVRCAWWVLKSGKPDALAEAYRQGATDRRSEEERQNQRVAAVLRMVKHES